MSWDDLSWCLGDDCGGGDDDRGSDIGGDDDVDGYWWYDDDSGHDADSVDGAGNDGDEDYDDGDDDDDDNDDYSAGHLLILRNKKQERWSRRDFLSENVCVLHQLQYNKRLEFIIFSSKSQPAFLSFVAVLDCTWYAETMMTLTMVILL